ncbi:MAG: sugar ABC transporter permease, partial [Anaerolineae bacterium]
MQSRRIREWREYITAYLMIAPATLLIFVFGIFPVGFALFVSLHKWRLKRSAFIGMENYVKALDNLAYVLFFALAIGLLILGWRNVMKVRSLAAEQQENPWLWLLPGFVSAATAISLVYWIYRLLPEVLDIADKIIGLEKTRELFLRLLGEAFHAEMAYAAWKVFLYFLIAFIAMVAFLLMRGLLQRGANAAYFFLLWGA